MKMIHIGYIFIVNRDNVPEVLDLRPNSSKPFQFKKQKPRNFSNSLYNPRRMRTQSTPATTRKTAEDKQPTSNEAEPKAAEVAPLANSNASFQMPEDYLFIE